MNSASHLSNVAEIFFKKEKNFQLADLSLLRVFSIEFCRFEFFAFATVFVHCVLIAAESNCGIARQVECCATSIQRIAAGREKLVRYIEGSLQRKPLHKSNQNVRYIEVLLVTVFLTGMC